MIIVYTILALLDIVTTIRALNLGATEKNILVMRNGSISWQIAITTKAIIFALILVSGLSMQLIVCTFTAYAVSSNILSVLILKKFHAALRKHAEQQPDEKDWV